MFSSLKDIFKGANLRVNNSIVAGFIGSFIVINWQVFVVLFTYKEVNYVAKGFEDVLDYLVKHFDYRNGLVTPLLSSLILNIALAGIDMLLNLIKVWIKNIQTEKERSMSLHQNAYISYAEHDEMKAAFEKQIEKINTDYAKPKMDIINEKNQLEKDNKELTGTNTTLEEIKKDLNNEVLELIRIKEKGITKNILEGTIFRCDKTVHTRIEKIEIFALRILVVEHDTKKVKVFEINTSRFTKYFAFFVCKDMTTERIISLTFQFLDNNKGSVFFNDYNKSGAHPFIVDTLPDLFKYSKYEN